MSMRWLVVAALLAFTACGGDGSEGPIGPTGSATAPVGGVRVEGTWAARISSPHAASFYFIATNDGERKDNLIGARSRDAGDVGLFEQGIDGSLALVPVDSVKVPGGGSVNFEPGGFEVVLMDVEDAIRVGESLSVTLEFERAGEITVDAEVRPFIDPATLPGPG